VIFTHIIFRSRACDRPASHMAIYRNRILPLVLDYVMSRDPFPELRRRTLAHTYGSVLEIGFGTGLNLLFYPPRVTSVTGVDPNPGMVRRAQRRIGLLPLPVTLVPRGADEPLPLPDASFDCAVSTWTLCTVDDVPAALRQIDRLLKPGAPFFFVEHGLADEPRVSRWQHRLTPLQRRIGGGCRLDRDVESLIRRSPLRLESLERFYLPEGLRIASFMYLGAARQA
jgi:ubiquinone/menaquinone biosynthesis C-methylase UbiE